MFRLEAPTTPTLFAIQSPRKFVNTIISNTVFVHEMDHDHCTQCHTTVCDFFTPSYKVLASSILVSFITLVRTASATTCCSTSQAVTDVALRCCSGERSISWLLTKSISSLFMCVCHSSTPCGHHLCLYQRVLTLWLRRE